jgi:hypothetical protein
MRFFWGLEQVWVERGIGATNSKAEASRLGNACLLNCRTLVFVVVRV